MRIRSSSLMMLISAQLKGSGAKSSHLPARVRLSSVAKQAVADNKGTELQLSPDTIFDSEWGFVFGELPLSAV